MPYLLNVNVLLNELSNIHMCHIAVSNSKDVVCVLKTRFEHKVNHGVASLL